ncbi:MAG: glycosyltransferase family 4 protein [Bacteroidota bacterium]
MSRKRYLYIVNVTRQLSIDMINHFHRQGAEVHLITGVIEVNYAQLDPGVRVTYLIKYNSTSAFRRLFTWMVFTVSAFFHVLFRSRKRELILITSPPFVVFLGWIFKKLRNQNYHLIIWDLYPDAMINFNMLRENSLLARVWKKMNRRCFARASTLFTLGKHLAHAMGKYTERTPVIVPNWVDTAFIKPVPRAENAFASRYGLTDKFVVMYSGNLGITHNIEAIVNTAELLKEHSNIRFLIIGEGAKKAKITQMVSEKGLDNVLLLPYQDKEVLPFSLGSADIGFVTLGEGAESVSVPSKTYYTFAAGSAVIALASKESELGLLVDKYQCGRIFQGSDCRAIADYILYLSQNNAELSRLKENARMASFDFTPANAALYYEAIAAAG